jgi:predicted nucleic acid-binding protein
VEGRKLRIYLDSCALSRPYDEYLDDEIAQDAEIIENIFRLVDLGSLILVDSEVLDIETQAIEDEEKRAKVNAIRDKAKYYVSLSPEVKRRASQFIGFGIKPMDALQLASAEKGAEVFITVDKRLLKKARKIHTLKMRVFNPVEFWRYYGGKGG